jgi:tRNA (guanine37-N1)-methyltransferase
MLQLGVITILPELIDALKHGMIQKAVTLQKVQIQAWNPRDWAPRPYCQVDDTPYGGGPGMVMRYEPLNEAIRFAKSKMPKQTRTIYMSPQGKQIKQQDLNLLVKTQQPLLFIAGRYEGIDERIIEAHVDEEWSIGDFVLSGGELAAMIFIDAIVRLIPGVLGHPGSVEADSFMQGCLDYPHYTKPALIDGRCVPNVLLSGNHTEIEHWRSQQALRKTWLKRPDLLEKLNLTVQDKAYLTQLESQQLDSARRK